MAESMQGLKRTHQCGHLTPAEVGQEVNLMGWVNTRREMVHRLSNGRIGYIHVPNTAQDFFPKLRESDKGSFYVQIEGSRCRSEDLVRTGYPLPLKKAPA
ncbi:MAG: hypothetical protein M0T74_09045 [Desulfitobacterium hafniense]|nr:hypothetical protein [Desulfitobacterium hafniense]